MASSSARYTSIPSSEAVDSNNGSIGSSPATSSLSNFGYAVLRPLQSNRFSNIASKTGVYGATLFVFICLALSLLLPSSIPSPASEPVTTPQDLTPAQRRDRTLSPTTCRREFPLLFPQLDANVAAWKAKGGISYTDLDEAARTCVDRWGMARVVIRDGQLYLRQVREGGESRISALLHLLHTAISTDPSSFSSRSDTGIELVLSEADKEASPSSNVIWVLSKRVDEPASKGTWLLPDFGFIGWPEAGIASFEEFTHLAQLQDHLVPWHAKGDKALWRGLANGYAPRMDLLARTDPRKVKGAEEWADVKQTSFHDVGEEFHPLIPMHEHCRHKYLIQTEGNSYSGRGKFLWICRSVTISHPLKWTQHFHPALNSNPQSPGQNFVELPGPLFSGLEETTRELQEWASYPANQTLNLRGALGVNSPQKIADNAVETLRKRYLTPAATNCYLRAALKAYEGVLKKDTWPIEENAAAWDEGGVGILPQGGPGGGVAPGGGKGKDLVKVGVKGDVEYGVWRLSGSPNWPPSPSQ
ncbi:uncharacterized protein UBRO_03095 [Ustilago bromivora]|uniref:Glycosyl transferase CAP10 domain-containing protein n=1 Tax=Ustilago bromivora TaxID=307758 RepID=A0A1K0H2X2_9BASI|nr:uncharacterized protein UBRO_03095 [Ustilago bromivora]SYW86132.1 uncharacterized protein UBRO2_05852 [Ustilago bromivora]